MKDCLPRIPTAVFILGLVTICPTLGLGNVIVSLNNPDSTTLHEITVMPGDAFAVDVNVDTDSHVLYAVNIVLQASASDVFQIVSRTNRGPWTEGGGGIGPLNPTSTPVGWGLPYPDYFGPGVSTLGTLELTVAPTSLESTYTIDLSSVLFFEDRAAPAMFIGAAGEGFIVHVIPEPSSSILTLGAALILVRVQTAKEKRP